MDWIHEFWLRVKALRHRRQLDRDLQDELQFHLAMREQSSSETSAHRRFGNVALLKESCRDLWTFACLETIAQDLRYGARMLRRGPAFTAVPVLSLGLGIGANTSIFSLMDAVLYKMLPVQHPEQLLLMGLASPQRTDSHFRIRNTSGSPRTRSRSAASRLPRRSP